MRGLEQIPWLYDAYMALMDAIGLGRWRRWLVQDAEGRTLDLGCGTGRNLRLFAGQVKVVGLELDLRMARRARRRAPGRPLVVARAESLPFKPAAFKTVVSSLVFCSVRDPMRGLSEVRRVLVAEGRLRMLEHVRSSRTPMARLQDLGQPVWTAISGGCHPNRDTELAVEQAGFRIDPGSRRARGSMRRFTARPETGWSTE